MRVADAHGCARGRHVFEAVRHPTGTAVPLGGGPKDLRPFPRRKHSTRAGPAVYIQRLPCRPPTCSPLWSNWRAAAGVAQDANDRFCSEKWRRRPDLNRGWRFCRFRAVVDLVDWPCPLVPDDGRSSLVFGPYLSRICLGVVIQSRARARTLASRPRIALRYGVRQESGAPPAHPYNRGTLGTQSRHPSRRLRRDRPAR